MDRANIPYSASAETQRLMAMQQTDSPLLDDLYPERKAKRIQEQRERAEAYWREQAKKLSDRELLEEIYVTVKMRVIL